ncbi:MAG TPA: amidohydrolase family protein [Phycisphaerae bacterium]|nr:amidohydrolase family protein [Phycisphaerae bacterium]
MKPLVYDVHTHVGLDAGFFLRGWWPYACTAHDLLGHMDAHGIDRAVCFPFTLPSAFDTEAFAQRGKVELLPGRVPFDRENGLLVQEVRRIDADRRLLPLAMFDPARQVDRQVRNLQALAEDIAGLKVQTTTIESPIKALLTTGRELMVLAEQLDLPVLMHTAVLPGDHWAQATDCLEVAAAYPKVRFNLAHSLRFHTGCLRQAAAMSNVWVDCAAHLAHCELARVNGPIIPPKPDRVDADYSNPAAVLETIHAMLPGRYMWGSDNPFMSWCDNDIRILYSYEREADVLAALPEPIRHSMSHTGPEDWLFGGKDRAS